VRSFARAPLLAVVLLGAGCGARSELIAGPPKPECVVDADCQKHGINLCKPRACQKVASTDDAGDGALVAKCVDLPEVSCDDGDPCSIDHCDPATAACSHEPATFDLDGDGHRAPLPGTMPGAPGSCGDDCDDTNPHAFPGNPEVCDGVDNDCNGVVDDNAAYTPVGGEVRISGDVAPASTGGLSYSGDSYAAIYTGADQVYATLIHPDGTIVTPPGEQAVTHQAADASGGPVLWIGDRYGIAWSDRRDGDYEMYFSILGADGTKRIPDVRLTNSFGFSIYPSLAWTSNEFIAAWQDDRDGGFNIYAQRIGVAGDLLGPNVALTSSDFQLNNESPTVAVGFSSVGLAWTLDDADTSLVQFQSFSFDLGQPASPRISVTGSNTKPQYPQIVWNKDRYVIAWYDDKATPPAVWAASVAEDGTLLQPPTPVTSPPAGSRSRYPSLRPLGDRLLLVYSDTRDHNQGYELYSRMLTPDLGPLTPELRVTNAQGDSIWPIASFGPEGDVGILFRDDREGGVHNIYFTHLGCVAQSP
jgi:hypothetical protein